MRPTKRQMLLLNFIKRFIKKHGYSPSYDEIKDGLEYNSKATIALHVNSLIERGYIRKTFNSARSLEVVTDLSIESRVKNALEHASLKDCKTLADALDMLDYPDLANKARGHSPG